MSDTQPKKNSLYYSPVTGIDERAKIKQWCLSQCKSDEALYVYMLLSDLQRAEARLVQMMGTHAPVDLRDLVNAAKP